MHRGRLQRPRRFCNPCPYGGPRCRIWRMAVRMTFTGKYGGNFFTISSQDLCTTSANHTAVCEVGRSALVVYVMDRLGVIDFGNVVFTLAFSISMVAFGIASTLKSPPALSQPNGCGSATFPRGHWSCAGSAVDVVVLRRSCMAGLSETLGRLFSFRSSPCQYAPFLPRHRLLPCSGTANPSFLLVAHRCRWRSPSRW